MKRLLAIALSIIMVFSLAACGDKEKAEKYCSNCGGGISKNVAYCEHCGAAVGTTQSTNSNASSDNTSSSESSSSNVDNTETQSKPAEETVSKPAETQKPTVQTHTHSYTSKTTAPTCTKQGYTTYTCSCGDSYKEHYVNTTAHSYSKKVTAATCTVQGYTTYSCSCGHTYKDNYTNPSHSYTKYKCTKCGAVDKSHAYEYLIDWVLENGKTSGSTISYRYNSDMTFDISYNTQSDYLYICQYGYVDGNFFYASINLDSWFFGVTLKNVAEVTGYLNHERFTNTYPLSYQKYDGPANSKQDFVEVSRIALVELIDWFEWTLNNKKVGITLKDVGFDNY